VSSEYTDSAFAMTLVTLLQDNIDKLCNEENIMYVLLVHSPAHY